MVMDIRNNRGGVAMTEVDPVQENIVNAYKNQLLIVLAGMLGGKLEIPIEQVDDYPIGKGLTVRIEGLKPAPELGEGRFHGKFVLEVIEIEDKFFVMNGTVGDG
jgi:hypothetical protein